MRYSELVEGINDKGIFKAIFFAGLPGAGKSTVAQRVTDGTVSPRIVNTDRSYEYLLKKHGEKATEAAWALLGPAAKQINSKLLTQYLNGMLPLFVDGTSANPGAAMRRTGIAESLGYDTAMVWVNVDLDVAVERIATRERKVNTEFVKRVYDTIESNKGMYQSRFGSNFIEVDNNADNYSAMEGQVYNVVNKFFTSPISNPIGQRIEAQMQEQGLKTLAPEIYSIDYLEKIVGVWYMK